MGKFEVRTPDSIEELGNCLKIADMGTTIISGGTDLMIKIRNHPEMDFKLIDISGVADLNYIKVEEGFVKIGATTTFTQIAENHDVIRYGACLAEAASQVGSKQIRNWGTIGGNIGNASPAGDAMPALCALDAFASVMDGEGLVETIEVRKVITGLGKTCIGKGRVITEVAFPARGEDCLSAFGKIGSRSTVTIAKLNMGIAIKYDRQKNTIVESNAALGALGPAVICSEEINNLLRGREVNEKLKEEFASALTNEVDRAIPARASRKYKRYAIRGLAFDIWEKLFKDGYLHKKEER